MCIRDRSPEESKIQALEAKVTSLEKRAKGNAGGDNKKKKGKGPKTEESDSKFQKPDWMTTLPPPEDIDNAKLVNGKKYYWCKPLKCFCRHHPKDCNAKPASSTDSSSSSISSKEDAKGKLRFSQALANVAEEGGNDGGNASDSS